MNNRQSIESAYHDKKAREISSLSWKNSQSEYYKYFYGLIGKVKNKRTLDLGSGDGWFSRQLISLGAEVIGIDISFQLLKKAMGINQTKFEYVPNYVKMAAENLAFKNCIFDFVIGSAILHHTDITASAKEVYRVLKTDGRAVFIEPMNENVVLKLWRLLTPWRRSPTERALNYHDISMLEQFYKPKMKFFIFCAIFSEGLLLLFPSNKLLRWLDVKLSAIDRYIINRVPFVRRFCGVVVFEFKKKV